MIRKFVCPEIIHGIDSRKLVGNYAQNLGMSRVLLVSDNGVSEAGWTGEVKDLLEEAGLEVSTFTNVTANPRDFEVMEGASAYKRYRCDGIVAVGGGSPIDCAKGIGIIVSNDGHIKDYEGVDRVAHPMPPQICIPTTSGTSADLSQFTIVLDTERKIKMAIVSKAVVPDLTLVDPQTLTTMSDYLTACTGLDALVHAIEAYVSNANSALSDIHAQNAISLIRGNLLQAIKNPSDISYRSALMQGSMQAGLAFSNASLGAVHAMAHSLGGMFDLPHGECNAILLNHVMAFNFSAAPERFETIGKLLGLELKGLGKLQMKNKIISSVSDFREKVGVIGSLSERGVGKTDLPYLSKYAVSDACMVTNPRKASPKDLEIIYAESL